MATDSVEDLFAGIAYNQGWVKGSFSLDLATSEGPRIWRCSNSDVQPAEIYHNEVFGAWNDSTTLLTKVVWTSTTDPIGAGSYIEAFIEAA